MRPAPQGHAPTRARVPRQVLAHAIARGALPDLETLHLSHMQIGDAGGVALAEARPLAFARTLRSLT